MAYLRLIWHYYDTEKPLQNDPESLAFIIGASVGDVNLILKHYFILDGDFWRKTRCDSVISEYHGKADKARKSAEARWNNAKQKQSNSECNANASPENANESKTDANQKPITNNQEPIEDQKIITPQAAQPATPEKKSRKTGSRLPDDWRPTQEHVDAAMQLNPDYTREWFSATAHKFRDYWVAKTGKDATKADWLATWRNWVRNDIEYNRGKANAKPKQLDHNNTDWINRAFESPASGQHGEQDFSFIDCDIPSLGCGDQRSGSHEPSEGGMVQGAD
jgi:uncharacterized protein YdaU (DUF1376 family)